MTDANNKTVYLLWEVENIPFESEERLLEIFSNEQAAQQLLQQKEQVINTKLESGELHPCYKGHWEYYIQEWDVKDSC